MGIRTQQIIAGNLYSKISDFLHCQNNGASVLLMGGAPRDWHNGLPCSDLDFFFYFPSGRGFRATTQYLFESCGISPAGTKERETPYEKLSIVDMQAGEYMGIPLHFVSSGLSLKKLMSTFHLSISQCYWDFRNHRAVGTWNWRVGQFIKASRVSENVSFDYLSKVKTKYPDWYFVDKWF